MYRKPTQTDMEAQGWKFGAARPCSRCGQMIYWGKHPESGRNYSFDLDTTEYHVKRCSQTAAKGPASTDAASARQPASPSTPSPVQVPASDGLQAAIAELAVAVRALAKAVLDQMGNQPSR